MTRLAVKVVVAAAVPLLVGALRSTASAQEAELLAVFGAGTVQGWHTELVISNPTDSQATVLVRNIEDSTFSCPPLSVCQNRYDLAPGQTVVGNPPESGIGITYIECSIGSPAVLARLVSDSGRSADLPVFRLATLRQLNRSRLVFAGATGGPDARANLIVAEMVDDATIPSRTTLRLEVIDSGGNTLGSRDIALEGLRLIVDVAGYVGVDSLEIGQLRVTRVSGTGSFWGIMPILRADGSLSIALGESP